MARKRVGETVYLYYRRAGAYLPLPGPEGSDAFLAAYERAHAAFEAAARGKPQKRQLQTIDEAITHYLGSAEYRAHRDSTRSDYRRLLDRFRAEFGVDRLADWTPPRIEALRRSYAPDPDAGTAGRPAEWNALRSRMISVTNEYQLQHPEAAPANHWKETQDVYGTGKAWTEEAMHNMGFRSGPWAQLKKSYRLPATAKNYARSRGQTGEWGIPNRSRA